MLSRSAYRLLLTFLASAVALFGVAGAAIPSHTGLQERIAAQADDPVMRAVITISGFCEPSGGDDGHSPPSCPLCVIADVPPLPAVDRPQTSLASALNYSLRDQLVTAGRRWAGATSRGPPA